MLVKAIPNNLKLSITAGIGLFIAFIGMRSAGIVTEDESNISPIRGFIKPNGLVNNCRGSCYCYFNDVPCIRCNILGHD